MKSVSISWVLGAVLAVCLTPGLLTSGRSSFALRHAAAHPAALAQAGGPVAVPGSADAQGPVGSDEGYQAGQAQPPDDPDAEQQPNMQQAPADDNGGDSSAQNGDDNSNAQQQSGDDADQGATPAQPQSNDDDN
jgi:hypothetical protein